MADTVDIFFFGGVNLYYVNGYSVSITGYVSVNYDPVAPTATSHLTAFTYGPGGLIDTTDLPVATLTSQVYWNFGTWDWSLEVAAATGYLWGAEFYWDGKLPTALHLAWAADLPIADAGSFLTYNANVVSVAVCFASGTRIRTPFGDAPVQSLQAGDTIVTASGERRRIKWVGHRRLRRDFGRTHRYETVRVAAHAFGPDRPSQDLVVSPGHAICVDLIGEVLVLAGDLVNGATVRREWVDQVTFWHVELDSHDILLANNLPAESYLAMGNRGFFEEAGATQDSFEDGRDLTHAAFCRPPLTNRAALAFAREQTLARARALGWAASCDDNLHLVVDGQIRPPLADQGVAMFAIPGDAGEVRLESDAFAPRDFGGDDDRRLGVALTGLVLVAGDGETRVIAMDDSRLREGVHSVEGGPGRRFRWTDGALVLDPALWSGMTGEISLVVSRWRNVARGWERRQARTEPHAAPAVGGSLHRSVCVSATLWPKSTRRSALSMSA